MVEVHVHSPNSIHGVKHGPMLQFCVRTRPCTSAWTMGHLVLTYPSLVLYETLGSQLLEHFSFCFFAIENSP